MLVERDLLLGAGVSRETAERLQLLEALVKKWNPVINLVSKGSLSDIYIRHILDSVQLFHIAGLAGGTWCDMGSGGGFPGLVIAAMAKDISPSVSIKLIDSDSRKAAFLREAIRELEVNALVVNSRIEGVPPLLAEVVSARALALLPKLCEFAVRHMTPSGVALFPKGANSSEEISKARAEWMFDLKVHPSKTDPAAAILELRNIQHV